MKYISENRIHCGGEHFDLAEKLNFFFIQVSENGSLFPVSATGADKSSASEVIPCTLWNPKVHYHINNSAKLFSIVSQIKSVPGFSIRFL
jgi:hypothetical protein